MRKRDRLVTCLEATVLSFLLGMSAISCLSTAFRTELTDLWMLAVYCAIAAVLCGVCYSYRLSLIPLCILALGAGYLWQSGILNQGLESLLYRLSRTYHSAYGWTVLRWSYRTAQELELTLAPILYIMGAVITLITAWVVARGHSSFWALLPAALPVLCCFVVTDTLPELVWLLLFMATALILMLSSSTRQEDPVQGNRLTAMVAVPALLAVTLLFYCIPEAGYHRQPQAQALSNTLFDDSPLQRLWEELTGQTAVVGSSVDGSSVDLTRVGYRQNSRSEILRVNTRYTGTLYLRGRALDAYTGTGWYDSQEDPQLYWPAAGNLNPIGEVVITTRYAHRMLYLPYYVTSIDTNAVTRGVENTNKLSMYSFTCRTAVENEYYYPDAYTAPSTYIGQDDSYTRTCTQLPESTLAWAAPLVEKITADMVSPKHKAQAIARYVRESADYDLQTRRMPTRNKDFAQWFLESSDSGYCVHFATAATVLLKAAGIPARYVTGYLVEVKDSVTAVVRAEDAHAWVEYWLPGFGWTVLEATPAAAPQPDTTEPVTQTVPATQPQQTDPTTDRTPAPTEEGRQEQPGQTSPVTQQAPMALTVLLWAAGGLLLLGLWVIQWRLRVLFRRKRRHRGSINRQILSHWQEATLLCRWLEATPDRQLHTLAEKARFSQHTMTPQELARFDLFLDTARQSLRGRSLLHRFFYTLILALY